MQDPSTFSAIKTPFPEQEHLKCPRCDSNNTKFCYYNNYNLSQPRHFCKNCRRYWTKGGALRNIPVGGGSRKNSKRVPNIKPHKPSSSSASSSISLSSPSSSSPKPEPASGAYAPPSTAPPPEFYRDRRMLEVPGSFSSLLASNGQFGGFLDGLNNPNGPGGLTVDLGEFAETNDPGSGRMGESGSNAESFLGFQNGNGDGSCWSGGGGGSSGWPDLAIYTPGSTYQ